MALAKKGTRVIVVDDISYRYKISKSKSNGQWREQRNELSEEFMKYARYYGLGRVKDISVNVTVQLKENPLSNLFVKVRTILIDGFMGHEQITEIKPSDVAHLIKTALDKGWSPTTKGDFRLEFEEEISKGNVVNLSLATE